MRLMHGKRRETCIIDIRLSRPCDLRKTEDDLIAVRAYDILKAEANLRDRKIVADLRQGFYRRFHDAANVPS